MLFLSVLILIPLGGDASQLALGLKQLEVPGVAQALRIRESWPGCSNGSASMAEHKAPLPWRLPSNRLNRTAGQFLHGASCARCTWPGNVQTTAVTSE